MRFYDHKSLLNECREQLEARKLSDLEIIREVRRRDPEIIINKIIWSEALWKLDRRPYYDLYPSVIEAFARTKFDIPISSIKSPMPAVLIRLPYGNGLTYNDRELRTLMIWDERLQHLQNIAELRALGEHAQADKAAKTQPTNTLMLQPDYGEHHKNKYGHRVSHVQVFQLRRDSDQLLTEWLADIKDPLAAGMQSEANTEQARRLFRIMTALCLLGDNPDLIEPLVLDKDRELFERTQDPALVEKAVGKGKRGWAVGARLSAAAGFRRPHFGYRWTGPGKTIPKLVPIKGCIVRRQKLEEIPTGYLDDLTDVTPLEQS